ncbi:unnamed protein product [Protopolystoma xenopodis]|uniref:Uncharacterized protein n=1 Tax=Protopolystoma xenopodis TaxID=117903 RepID=A0A448WP97_9PLAT|nr:unnamed protein product [Protopolystoma xenopodis]
MMTFVHAEVCRDAFSVAETETIRRYTNTYLRGLGVCRLPIRLDKFGERPITTSCVITNMTPVIDCLLNKENLTGVLGSEGSRCTRGSAGDLEMSQISSSNITTFLTENVAFIRLIPEECDGKDGSDAGYSVNLALTPLAVHVYWQVCFSSSYFSPTLCAITFLLSRNFIMISIILSICAIMFLLFCPSCTPLTLCLLARRLKP